MTFAYSEYLINNLLLPIFALAFIAVPVFKALFRLLGQLVRKESVDFGDSKAVLLLIALIVVAVILGNILFHGGIHLIYERAASAVTTQGTIEEIQACSILESPKYTAGGESSNGYEITIDGTTCRTMALGSLEVGDEVTVTYMPKSGFVLTIEEVNP